MSKLQDLMAAIADVFSSGTGDFTDWHQAELKMLIEAASMTPEEKKDFMSGVALPYILGEGDGWAVNDITIIREALGLKKTEYVATVTI